MANWTPLRDALAEVEASVTYRWADLDALVGGLPQSAYVHSAFWKGARSGWPGFTTIGVRVNEEVTFVRDGSTVARRREPLRQAAHANVTPIGRPDLILVSCVKKKLDRAAPARDLYTSDLFRKEREYAERSGVPWFILSAEHGLVEPAEELEPYDLHLAKTTAKYRDAWGVRVVDRLEDLAAPINGKVIEVHAGSAYGNAIRGRLVAKDAQVIEPLQGLALGPRLAWYRRTLTSGAPTNRGAGITHIAESQTFITWLTNGTQAESPSEFLARGGAGLRSPGLYSWWVDADGAADLSRGLGHSVLPGLIYAGLAGATRPKSGLKSKNTLWGRIKTMHLGGRHEFSTFRPSLGSVLAEATGAAEIDEHRLTEWMHAHLQVVAVPVADADILGALETDVLAQLNPPLNLDKVMRDPLRTQLSALRKKYGRKQRGPSGASAG